ncbi:MAG: hypothetical protein RLZ05_1017 [Bacteroidota bacterium]|jgi:putative toxin-antitoxin system antitoxin component (TIGR02293 family)
MDTAEIASKLGKEITSLVKRSKLEYLAIRKKGAITYDDFLADKMLMRFVIQEGVPYNVFRLIQDITPLTEENWADLLDLSTKSMHRYKQQSKVFRPIQSEKIIEMAEVTKIGIDFFGDREKFKTWLLIPNFALGNTRPIDLLKDSYGKEMVVAELTRVAHGIFI